MGFALYLGDGVAWAEGTHEYRPMGTAVIAVTDQFRPRDFHPTRKPPKIRSAGFFGSIVEVNEWLAARRFQFKVQSE